MITKCCFCDYQKSSPLSQAILKVLAEPNIPFEDWELWSRRLIDEYGFKEYHSVKIHMGIKHKDQTYKYIIPVTIFEPNEKKLIDKQKVSA